MLLVREVEFTMDALLDKKLVSKGAYQMTPMEMREFKAQLEEILGKGYI